MVARHLSFCRYDSIKIVSRQALGPIPHTSQEWQSSLIGIDRATKIRAFQSQVCASSPRIALDFNESHAAMSDKAPTPHRPFQSRHLKCFLFIKMWVSKIRFVDLLLFYHMIKNFSSPKIKIWFEPMFFSGFFCGFYRCGFAAFSEFFRGGISSPPQAAKTVRTISRILHTLENGKPDEAASLRSAVISYSILGVKTNSRFRILGEENFLILNPTTI
jgi:hypothetical protein